MPALLKARASEAGACADDEGGFVIHGRDFMTDGPMTLPLTPEAGSASKKQRITW
jgi:hypothetical protein